MNKYDKEIKDLKNRYEYYRNNPTKIGTKILNELWLIWITQKKELLREINNGCGLKINHKICGLLNPIMNTKITRLCKQCYNAKIKLNTITAL